MTENQHPMTLAGSHVSQTFLMHFVLSESLEYFLAMSWELSGRPDFSLQITFAIIAAFFQTLKRQEVSGISR